MISRVLDLVRRSSPGYSLRGLPPRYTIVAELGRGGVAVVYLARDRQLERDVAVKVLQSALSADDNTAARLEREARLVASLQHPHIVAIYDLQHLRSRSVALVMQYVRGRTLRGIINDQRQLPISFIERVLKEIAGALAYAHRSGIVHRDVKPENIYLEEETGRALLADFGIARGPNLEAGLTLAGEALGTPHYMSPEHISGGELDGRSDMYSLGLVAYEMLTGQRPWGGETLYNILHKQQHENLPPPGDFREDIPVPLLAALRQSLRKKRSERPSADAFLSLLSGGAVDLVPELDSDRDASSRPGSTSEAAPHAETVRYLREDVPGSGGAALADAPSAGSANTPPFRHPPERNKQPDEPAADIGSLGPSRQEVAAQNAAPPLIGHSLDEVVDGGIDLFAVGDSAPGRTDARSGSKAALSIPKRPGLAKTRRFAIRVSPNVASVLVKARMAVMVGAAATFMVAATLILTREVPSESATLEQPDSVALGDSAAAPVRPPQRSGAAAPRPGGGGSRARRGLAGAARAIDEWKYVPAGDITDRFCRPRPSEVYEDWTARVPTYCRDRAQ